MKSISAIDNIRKKKKIVWNRVGGQLVALGGVVRSRGGILKRKTEFTPEYSQFLFNVDKKFFAFPKFDRFVFF